MEYHSLGRGRSQKIVGKGLKQTDHREHIIFNMPNVHKIELLEIIGCVIIPQLVIFHER